MNSNALALVSRPIASSPPHLPPIPGPHSVAVFSPHARAGKSMIAASIGAVAVGRGLRTAVVSGQADGPFDLEEEHELLDRLEQVEEQADLVVFDAATGEGPQTKLFAALARTCVLTMIPEPGCLPGACATARFLARQGVRSLRVVVNHAGTHVVAEAVFSNFAAATGCAFPDGMTLLGSIPADADVARAAAGGGTVVERFPGTRAAVALARMTDVLIEEAIDHVEVTTEASTWWQRLRRSARLS